MGQPGKSRAALKSWALQGERDPADIPTLGMLRLGQRVQGPGNHSCQQPRAYQTAEQSHRAFKNPIQQNIVISKNALPAGK